MDSAGFLWGIMTIGGPILLVLAILYAVIRNQRSKVPMEVTERGTRKLYEEEERARED